MAEDFAPFDVDVTTVEPPTEFFQGIGGRAVRVLFTSHFDDARLHEDATGNNWVGSDTRGGNSTPPTTVSGQLVPSSELAWNANVDRPIWVFANEYDGFVTREHPDTSDDNGWVLSQENIGGIASHELGHAFGVMHDGINIYASSGGVQVRDYYAANSFTQFNYYGGHTDPGTTTNAATSWGPIMGAAMLGPQAR